MTRKDKFLRKCVGCGNFFPKESLIKITKECSSGKIVVSPDSKTFGRSAYTCKNMDCVIMTLKGAKLSKNLRAKIAPELFEKISAVLEK